MSLRSRQIDELEACFVVKDATSHKLGYFYYEEEPGRRSAAKLLTTSTIRYALKELLPSGNLRHQSGEGVKAGQPQENEKKLAASPNHRQPERSSMAASYDHQPLTKVLAF